MSDLARAIPICLCLVLAAPALADRVDDHVRQAMASRHITGATLAVIRGGKVVKKAAYGFANLELGVKTKLETVFEIGSLTKQFTATLVMMLQEEGKLRLDQPIGELLPNTPPTWAKITVRNLLGHTSGLKNINDLPGYELYRGLDYAKFMEGLQGQPLEFEPGSKYAYRNTGYALAGYIVQHVCKKPYFQVLKERIFDPLKMTSSQDRHPTTIIRNRADGYDWTDGKLVNKAWNITDISAAGAIASCVPDLVLWNAALDANRVIKPDSLQQMWTAGKLSDGKPTTYGLGWGVNQYRGVRLISHGGSTSGFSASISKFVDNDLTVIVLTNCETLNVATVLGREVAGFYLNFPAKAP